MGIAVDYTCDGCFRTITGAAGDDVHCKRCGIMYKTDWEYTPDDTIRGWITGKKKK